MSELGSGAPSLRLIVGGAGVGDGIGPEGGAGARLESCAPRDQLTCVRETQQSTPQIHYVSITPQGYTIV